MKILAALAVLLAMSSTQAFSISKRHFSGLASLQSVSAPLAAGLSIDAPAIKKCAPCLAAN